MDLLLCMEFNVVNNFNHIVAMETSTKPNFSLCMDKPLTILKNICDRHVTLTKQHFGNLRGLPEKDIFPYFYQEIIIPLLVESLYL